jgi:hypothetical protein
MITDSVEPEALGAAHGLASTCAAAVRTLAPPLAGTLWEIGRKRSMPWLAFFFIASVGALGSYGTHLGAQIASAIKYEKAVSVDGDDDESDATTVDTITSMTSSSRNVRSLNHARGKKVRAKLSSEDFELEVVTASNSTNTSMLSDA